MNFVGLNIVVKDFLGGPVAVWNPRSPGRARRRGKLGHRQHFDIVEKEEWFRVGNTIVCSPAAYDRFCAASVEKETT